MTSAISIRNLSKRYGKLQVLNDVSIDVPHGSIFGFLGPNGAGKSTTIRILAGLSQATSGSAFVNGVSVDKTGLHRRHLGYVAQEPRFYGWMTGREVMEYSASFYGEVSKQRIADLLDRVGIAAAANRPCQSYSGGMRQRLGIAQALIGKPAVVIMDEPVSALDSIGRAEVLKLMQSLRGETTIFYSTHILEDVQRLSDYVAILNQGKLVKMAPTQALLNSFANGSLRVTLAGAKEAIADQLKLLPGVVHSSLVERLGIVRVYDVQVKEGAMPNVQRSITQFAARQDLILVTNEPTKIELETVFLQLVQTPQVS
ncbi:MAG: ABC transporter ATP-binding protein [Leptolyngbyaceae cyanobacterium SM1_3_5]|nr:ABC transporter ATP-binding protein [Leptolyngbyaceae cyanobacterium SM1_3_5]